MTAADGSPNVNIQDNHNFVLDTNVLDDQKRNILVGSKTDRGPESQRDTIEGIVAQFNSDTILNNQEGTASKTHRTQDLDPSSG